MFLDLLGELLGKDWVPVSKRFISGFDQYESSLGGPRLSRRREVRERPELGERMLGFLAQLLMVIDRVCC